MIPQERQDAVARALDATFGTSQFEDIRTLTNGLSGALVYRIVVGGRAYLLRIIMRTADPTLPDHIQCMKIAAEADLAPRVRYTSVPDRIVITDFIDGAIPFPASEALVRMPRALRALHALPPFPTRVHAFNTTCTFLLNKHPALDGFLEKFRAANPLPRAEAEKLFAVYDQVSAIYRPPNSDMVSSHNDLLKPDNVVFDGQRLWLVDWEAAFLNDRYVDLAVVADFLVFSGADEDAYLREYFGKAPDELERTRFFLMRVAVHMFYAMGLIWLGSAGKPVDWSEPVPAFAEFQQGVWNGEAALSGGAAKVIYGRVHLQRLFDDVEQPRFEEALGTVSVAASA